MDFSNYEEIVRLVSKFCKGLSKEDKEDLVQEVCLKMLVSDHDGKASKTAIIKTIQRIKINMHRAKERKPLVFDNELVERYPGEGNES